MIYVLLFFSQALIEIFNKDRLKEKTESCSAGFCEQKTWWHRLVVFLGRTVIWRSRIVLRLIRVFFFFFFFFFFLFSFYFVI